MEDSKFLKSLSADNTTIKQEQLGEQLHQDLSVEIKEPIKIEYCTDVIIQNEVRDGRPVNVVYMFDTAPALVKRSKTSVLETLTLENHSIVKNEMLPAEPINIKQEEPSTAWLEDNRPNKRCKVTMQARRKGQFYTRDETTETAESAVDRQDTTQDDSATHKPDTFTEKMFARTFVRLVDLQIPKQAIVNSSSGQIDEQTFVCLTCGVKFSSIQHLQDHVTKETFVKKENSPDIGKVEFFKCTKLNQCKLCTDDEFGGRSSRDQGLLTNNFSTDKNKQCKYTCQFCDKGFKDKIRWVNHERLHTGEKPYKCTVCNRGFTEKHNWLNHQRFHTREFYTCTYCDRKFVYLLSLKRHQERSAVISEGKACRHCGQVFTRTACLRYHEGAHFSELLGGSQPSCIVASVSQASCKVKSVAIQGPFTCRFCGKQLKYKGDLKRHEYAHVGERKFDCRFCGRRFMVKSYLNAHVKQMHIAVKYKCEYCDARFSRNSKLFTHVEREHVKEEKYSCSVCDKRFTSRESLARHGHKHTLVKKGKTHPCATCGKAFPTRVRLVEHERVHSGEKPYLCTTCGRAFAIKRTLADHELSHTGIKRHKCHLCKKLFSCRKGLGYHLTHVHSDK